MPSNLITLNTEMNRDIDVKTRQYSTRIITEADLPALEADTGSDQSKRVRPDGNSYHNENCVMVVEVDGKMIGCVAVLFARPLRWPDEDDGLRLPELRSLGVNKVNRNQGAGTCLIKAVEDEVRSRGRDRLHLSVDPEENAGAHRLYLRLGFEPISNEKHRSSWTWTNDKGEEVEVVEWLIDMVKML